MSSASSLSTTNVGQALRRLSSQYIEKTPTRLKLVDAFLAFVLATGILEFTYCVIAGSFPYNSFLAGFISTVGTFVLTGTRVLTNQLPRIAKKERGAAILKENARRA